MSDIESSDTSTMVTNVELAKMVEEQEEDNKQLRERIAQLEAAVRSAQFEGRIPKEEEVAEEDKTPEPDPVLKEEPFLKALKALSGKALEGIPLFSGKMEPDLVMDWIEGMENHFECDGVTEAQKVKVAKSRLRGSALTWWKFVQTEREKEGKQPISAWKGMVAKVKEAYMPNDYEIQLHKKRQSLRQKDQDVNTYTEEFQKLCLRSNVAEDESLKVARYLNGLKWNIQEEMALLSPKTVHQCYQLAIKIEERNKRKHDQSSKGRGRGRDQRGQRGGYQGRGGDQRSQGESKLTEHGGETSSRGGFNRGRGPQGGSNRGRGAGRSNSYFATMKCYHCNQLGHPAYRCPEKASSSNEKKVAYAQEDTMSVKTPEISHIESKVGENLMFNRVLIRQPVKEEPKQRRALFRARCKILGKVCKVIVDSGSTDNIISDLRTISSLRR